MLPRDEVFRLQLISAARRELHTEMRQAFVPWPDDSLLRCTAGSIMPGERVEFFGGRSDTEELGDGWSLIDAPLDPDLIYRAVAVGCE